MLNKGKRVSFGLKGGSKWKENKSKNVTMVGKFFFLP
jgi:hypothetical protein